MKKIIYWLTNRFFKHKTLYFKLNLIFCLFFFVPVVSMLYFGIHYQLLEDRHLPAFFMALLAVSFIGLTLLRKVFDDISEFSNNLSLRVKQNFPKDFQDDSDTVVNEDELAQLVKSFSVIDQRMDQISKSLAYKCNQVKTLRSLANLCYVTADPDEILYLVLERALTLTASNMGSIMLLDQPFRDSFTVHSTIGLEKYIQPKAQIKFESSIAKYAILNKSAVVVKDIESDTRFGRMNRSQYGSKSFACLPIKTSREIIGVLTLSSTNPEKVYQTSEIDILEPLLSIGAFTYENILMTRDQADGRTYLDAMDSLLEIISSSYQGSELLQAALAEIGNLASLERAVVFECIEKFPKEIVLLEVWAENPILLARGTHYPITPGGALDKVLQQRITLVLDNCDSLLDENIIELSGIQCSQSAIVVPLKIESAVTGLLVLVAKERHTFSGGHRFADRVAACISLAVERNRLRQAVVKRNRELDSLRQIGGALASSTFDITQVLNYTMEMIRVLMNVENGTLYLVNENKLEFAVAFNNEKHEHKPMELKLGQGIPGYVAARGEAMMVNEDHDTSLFMPEQDSVQAAVVRSALCVPMISQGKVIGVIEVLNKTNGDFGPDDQDLLKSIASSVSIAIENASLYKETVTRAENERGIRRIFQKFVPKEVLDKILHGSATGQEMMEELKILTLINIDIRNFSGLAKSLGPQRTVSLLNGFFSHMGSIVFKHHGIVDKYLGDGFLALFGAPVSSVADADNAIAAALEMQSSLSVVNAALSREMGVQLKIGISIHTGEVVVGNIGFDMKMDYTVIGDSVNDVFRLQDKVRAHPNSIFISQNTLRATRVPLNYIEQKERLGQIKIYELLGFANKNGLEKEKMLLEN